MKLRCAACTLHTVLVWRAVKIDKNELEAGADRTQERDLLVAINIAETTTV